MNAVVAASAGLLPVAVGALVARAQRWIGWLLVADGISFWLVFAAPGPGGRADLVVAQLAAGAWVFLVVWVALIAYLLPDGRPGSRRWGRWLHVVVPGVVALLVGSAGDAQGFRDAHHGVDPPLPWLPQSVSGVLGVLGLVLTLAFLLGSVVAVRWRLARAQGEDRIRLLWLVWGSFSLPVGLVGGWVAHFGLHDNELLADVSLGLAAVGIPVTIGISVLRHRLFDVQVVLARTVVYATLTIVLAVLYGGLLVGADQMLGNGTIGGAVAVVVVAVVSAPLYARVRRRAEHWVYGYRSDPAEALRRFGARVESVDPLQLVEAVTAAVADAVRVERVWIDEGGGASAPGTPTRVPLVHRGESIGDLVVQVPSGRTLSPADLALLDDLARQVAVTVRAAQLAIELQGSRSRIIAAREEERKRLRRDLHDGLGPALAAVVLKLGAAESRRDEEERNAILAEIRRETRSAIAEVRRLVDDLRPPAIDEVGLVGAIRQRAATLSSDALRFSVVGPVEVPPLPAAVEVAAFRIASEAIANVARHSGARACTIALGIDDQLELTVTDDGVGGARPTRTGVGWTSMTERAEELGGSCTISDRRGGGLQVRALLPIAEAPARGTVS
ncbi:sensor histidine kinase [Phycicoccus sp.]|uniref:sensor histidine kinase n=1 Tax=Phycicoccus sp. TaxID=1902410 RepID=UPI002BDBE1AB|nr:sensor histidine kinase [Phycicoccus sp.]HMM94536.1 sensor histidine kinase [Phycicoccus sp.]